MFITFCKSVDGSDITAIGWPCFARLLPTIQWSIESTATFANKINSHNIINNNTTNRWNKVCQIDSITFHIHDSGSTMLYQSLSNTIQWIRSENSRFRVSELHMQIKIRKFTSTALLSKEKYFPLNFVQISRRCRKTQAMDLADWYSHQSENRMGRIDENLCIAL